jgi:hypothetical protein
MKMPLIYLLQMMQHEKAVLHVSATAFSPRKTVVCCIVASFERPAAACGDHVWSLDEIISLL